MKLRNITPVQALALIAAAAGCGFEPIFSPLETGEQEDRIIGYRFEMAKSSTAGNQRRSSATWMLGGLGGGAVPPQSTSLTEATPLRRGDPKVSKPASAVDLAAPGEGDFIYSENGGSPMVVAVRPSNDTDDFGNDFFGNVEETPTTQIYALGDSLGSDKQERTQGSVELQELVTQALAMAELRTKENPQMAFHEATRALVVKGTVEQHEIIQQAVSAMIESRSASSSKGLNPGR